MVESFPLIAHSLALPGGPRVRLRLAQLRDVGAIARLLSPRPGAVAELEVARLVKSNPREQIAICATALIDLRETVVGFAAMPVGAQEPGVVLVDETQTAGLAPLMTQALRSRSAAIAVRPAA